MDGLYRPCPVCGRRMMKRELPENFSYKDYVPHWYRYECLNCGSSMFLQPFAEIKQVAKG